ncbi:MAG: hypothetical protein P8X89_24665, partial [Reinekea sp.]
GQTSGGVAASGASWSYPGQSYQNFNVQPQTPFSPGPDWESALRTPQPMAMEDIIHSPIHLQDSQYSSQPETGQTSAGVSASGPWWNQPAPGQLQPHQGFNVPAQIPPSFGSDLEYLQQTLQPMVVEDAVQNDASLMSFSLQPAVAPPRRPAKERFLEGLEAFARGLDLKDCTSSIRFTNYIKSDGTMTDRGRALYNQFTDEEKTLLGQAIIARQEFVKDPVEARFLAGLDKYEQGARLMDCSETIQYKHYVTDNGGLLKRGKELRSRLSAEDRERLDQALLSRRICPSKRAEGRALFEERFLASLDNYANGLKMSKCGEGIALSKYVTDDGNLHAGGEALRARLSPEDQNRVDRALAARRRKAAEEISGDLPYFMAALEPYGEGLNLQLCANQPGLQGKERYQKVERYLTREGGLTAKGELLIENLQPMQQNYVLNRLAQRLQRMEQSTQVQESPWQLSEMPASMPEMGGMAPTAMVDPMQTETMMVAAWQYAGQAMPGIWGIPSESAEPSIPYYGPDVVGRDFQHRYDSNGLMPQRAPDRLIGLGIVHDMLINIQGEVYRVHDTGQRSVNPTNENPLGNIF